MVVKTARVMRFQQFDGFVCFVQSQIDICHFPVERLLTDLRVGILPEQRKALLRQLQRP